MPGVPIKITRFLAKLQTWSESPKSLYQGYKGIGNLFKTLVWKTRVIDVVWVCLLTVRLFVFAFITRMERCDEDQLMLKLSTQCCQL